MTFNATLSAEIASYSVAQDNIIMGLDMIVNAMDSLSLVSDNIIRIRELVTKVSGLENEGESLNAIQFEIKDCIKNVQTEVANTEKRGIQLFQISENSVGKFAKEVIRLSEEEALEQGYTVIKTADELQAMQKNLSGKYILMNNINLWGYRWKAIGDGASKFSGLFNGNGYIISNLVINNSNHYSQGIFGFAHNAKIFNVGVENVEVQGGRFVGALVGRCAAEVINCYSTGNVMARGDSVGGLFGVCTSGAVISECYSGCNVAGSFAVGGLVGNTEGTSFFHNSFAMGNVTGSNCVGGFAGNACFVDVFSNCYSVSNVDGKSNVGGLFGIVGNEKTVINKCYSLGKVCGETKVGAFAGCLCNYNSLEDCGYNFSINLSLLAIGDNQAGYNLDGLNSNIALPLTPNIISFQLRNNLEEHLDIDFDVKFALNLVHNISDKKELQRALKQIEELMKKIKQRQKEFLIAYNRLENIFETIEVRVDNLITADLKNRTVKAIKGASKQLRQQIVEQAESTLKSVANQSPSMALQLI